MRIGIDVREACNPHRTGKGLWTEGFLLELLSRHHTFTLFTDRPLPDAWYQHASFQREDIDVVTLAHSGWRWHLDAARLLVREGSLDLYVSPTSYLVPNLVASRLPIAIVVHDLIAFRDEPHERRAMLIERLTLGRAAAHSAIVCTVSEATRSDLLARCTDLDPAAVVTVYAGCSWAEKPPPTQSDNRTILCISTLCPRKNQGRLIEAYRLLPDHLRHGTRLLLVGKRGWHDDDIVRLARETDGVTWSDYLSDAECSRLLSTCAVFAYPSLYEGFGMPVLDALARGIPVLTSAHGSLQELAEGAALTADPEDPKAIARGLERLLTDPALRVSLTSAGRERAAQYSWKRTVDLFEKALPLVDNRTSQREAR